MKANFKCKCCNYIFHYSLNTLIIWVAIKTLHVQQLQAKKAPAAWLVNRTQHKKQTRKNNTLELLFILVIMTGSNDSCLVEVNRWYHNSCFVRSQQIFIHSLLKIAMASPGTHIVKNHESQFKKTRNHTWWFKTRQFIWRQITKLFITVYWN